MEKILKARLKEPPQVAVKLDFDFSENWIAGASLIERSKQQLFLKIKNDMHEKIALLSMDDLEFSTIETT